jgi:hypothetical protein
MNALNITFTDRATYKAWTAEWKANHAKLLTDIRAAKHEIKNANRDINGGRNVGRVWTAYSTLRQLHNDLYESLATRAKAKAEAQRQYLAEKAIAA